MSYKQQDLVWGFMTLSANEKFVLLTLAYRSDESGSCWPSAVDIANLTGLNVKTVRKCLRTLESKGFLLRENRSGKSSVFQIQSVDEPTQNRTDALPKNGTTKNGNTQKRVYQNLDQGSTQNRTDTLPKFGSRTSQEQVIEQVNTKKESSKEKVNPRGNSFSLKEIPAEWIDAAEKIDPEIDPQKAFADFADYWRAIPGEKGRKKDWLATWRNSIRNIPDWKRKKLLKNNRTQSPSADPWDDPNYYGESGELI